MWKYNYKKGLICLILEGFVRKDKDSWLADLRTKEI